MMEKLEPDLAKRGQNFSENTSGRCFFTPPSMRNRPKPIFGDFNGFPQILVGFQSVSIDFLSFSISFSRLQSILISFNQFDPAKNAGIDCWAPRPSELQQ